MKLCWEATGSGVMCEGSPYSKLVDAPPPNPLVAVLLCRPKWEKRLSKLFSISALDA